MSSDPICTTCHEPKSAHVKTDKGPYTHPREARGEGTFVQVSAGGTLGRLSPADDDWHIPPTYRFVPATNIVGEPLGCGIDDPADAEDSG